MDERLEIELERISDFRLELNKLIKKRLLDFSINQEELVVALLCASIDAALNREKLLSKVPPIQALLNFLHLAIHSVEEHYNDNLQQNM